VVDERSFRDVLGRWVTGVAVITTVWKDQVHGMTANAVMSVSLKPPLILISIDEKASMLAKVRAANNFAVSILSSEQKALSLHFSGQRQSKETIDFDWYMGLPVIKNALAYIVCKVHEARQAGDHVLFLGEVEHLWARPVRPLIFYQGRYHALQDMEDKK
jgi:flavin reductase (DIM6/NTAB) family NADH-FMN oxidoreductase RutF